MDAIWPYAVFTLVILALLALDLGVFHRKAHKVSVREALGWSAVWIGLAFAFNAWIWVRQGPTAGLEFLTGYLVEKSLSVDNIFVFLIVFAYFAVPEDLQHRVLFWGILGALVMRGIMIFAGALLITRFHWVTYIFGGFLILTALKLALQKEGGSRPDQNPVVRAVRRLMPVTEGYEGDKFFVRRAGALCATPLFLVLATIEFTDLVFAVDSIPAIFAITEDPYIVYTSNVFAILGLRSLYFALADVVPKFRYLKPALAVILAFVGTKMLIVQWWKIPPLTSLGVIVTLLAGAVVFSVLRPVGGGERRTEGGK